MPEEASAVEEIAKLIASINPNYAEPESRSEVKRKLSKSIQEAVKVAKPMPCWEHKLVYDLSAREPLEPVYFWILDFMQDGGFEVEKLIDNFAASPGSGYFADLVGRARTMQEEGMRILGQGINPVVRSIITLLYDLREFEVFLRHYDMANSKDPKEREAGILGLKQRWLDRVDAQKGAGSINALSRAAVTPGAGEPMFATLRDAFMVAKRPEDVDRMDLSDTVKRILKPRIAEFLEWLKRSEAELRKRYDVEKNYLKSQVGSLKLYARWAKPYLKAAEELMLKEKAREPALVKAFGMILLELCLLCKQPLDVKKEVDLHNLPPSFREKKWKRKYYSCVLIDFSVRGFPVKGAAAITGRADISFKAFALNDDELAELDRQLTRTDLEDAFRVVELTTGESLARMAEDLEHFLGKEVVEEIVKPTKPAKKPKPKAIPKDSFEESVLRTLAERYAANACFTVYHTFKKAHGMATFFPPEFGVPPFKKLPPSG